MTPEPTKAASLIQRAKMPALSNLLIGVAETAVAVAMFDAFSLLMAMLALFSFLHAAFIFGRTFAEVSAMINGGLIKIPLRVKQMGKAGALIFIAALVVQNPGAHAFTFAFGVAAALIAACAGACAMNDTSEAAKKA